MAAARQLLGHGPADPRGHARRGDGDRAARGAGRSPRPDPRLAGQPGDAARPVRAGRSRDRPGCRGHAGRLHLRLPAVRRRRPSGASPGSPAWSTRPRSPRPWRWSLWWLAEATTRPAPRGSWCCRCWRPWSSTPRCAAPCRGRSTATRAASSGCCRCSPAALLLQPAGRFSPAPRAAFAISSLSSSSSSRRAVSARRVSAVPGGRAGTAAAWRGNGRGSAVPAARRRCRRARCCGGRAAASARP